jgi:NAD(P)-dependent dehydrogenase (short-subunit alcohol dehydrogenase family)
MIRPGRLAGRTAIVTGAASAAGLGFAIATRYAEEGARLLLTDVSADVHIRAEELTGDGAAALGVRHDVRDEASWLAVFAAARASFGGIDLLVNNAGITRRSRIDEMDLETYRAVVDTNLTGAWLGCKHGVAEMKRTGTGGAIVNIASISGVVGMRFSSPYGASKGGIRSLTKVVALEGAPDGIRCNAICPGIIATEIVAPVQEADPAAYQRLLDGIPMGRLGDADDIAHAAVYLASDEARYVTGAEIRVDGGYTAQ